MNAYQQGREAYLRKTLLTNNPYFSGTAQWKEWRRGWQDAEKAWGKQ